MANKNRHKIVAVFVAFCVSLFSIFYHFLLVSPCFLLFHDVLEPQNSPPNEVTGYMAVYIYIHTYIHTYMHLYLSIYVPTPSIPSGRNLSKQT